MWWVAGHGLMQPLAPLRSILAFHLSVSLCSHPQLTHCQSPLQPLLHLLDCQGEGQPWELSLAQLQVHLGRLGGWSCFWRWREWWEACPGPDSPVQDGISSGCLLEELLDPDMLQDSHVPVRGQQLSLTTSWGSEKLPPLPAPPSSLCRCFAPAVWSTRNVSRVREPHARHVHLLLKL